MRALIFGITGQDGSLLARHLLDRSQEVTGTTRDMAPANLRNLAAPAPWPSPACRRWKPGTASPM